MQLFASCGFLNLLLRLLSFALSPERLSSNQSSSSSPSPQAAASSWLYAYVHWFLLYFLRTKDGLLYLFEDLESITNIIRLLDPEDRFSTSSYVAKQLAPLRSAIRVYQQQYYHGDDGDVIDIDGGAGGTGTEYQDLKIEDCVSPFHLSVLLRYHMHATVGVDALFAHSNTAAQSDPKASPPPLGT